MRSSPTIENLLEIATEAAESRSKDPSDPVNMYLDDYEGKYLKSNLWRRIKRRILKRDNNRCAICGGGASTVHHRTYDEDVIRGDADEKLASVCEGCHRIIHFYDDDVTRRPQAEWDHVLLTGQSKLDYPEPKIDLRRRGAVHPSDWSRMTAVQRSLWLRRYNELKGAKLRARAARTMPSL